MARKLPEELQSRSIHAKWIFPQSLRPLLPASHSTLPHCSRLFYLRCWAFGKHSNSRGPKLQYSKLQWSASSEKHSSTPVPRFWGQDVVGTLNPTQTDTGLSHRNTATLGVGSGTDFGENIPTEGKGKTEPKHQKYLLLLSNSILPLLFWGAGRCL